MLADLKYALRQLRKSPGFAATAILTLAIGIGANSVVFSVLNTLVIRPLDLPNAEQLVFLERMPMEGSTQSYPDYRDMRDETTALSGLAAYRFATAGIDTGRNPSKIWFYEASGNYFDVAGVEPYLGRFFHAADEHGVDSAPYAVLSYGYWRSHFGGDPQIVGKTIEIDKRPFSVIGVAPEKFRGTELFFSPTLWVPLVNEEQIDGWNFINERGNHTMYVVGRVKPGVGILAAEAELNRIANRLAAQYPQSDQGLQIRLARPGLIGNTLGHPVRAFLGGVMLLAALILLAACANLGSLFAARAADRSREMAIRLALGSSRERLFRQLLTEAAVVSLAGGLLGVQGAAMLLRWLSGWQVIPNSPIQVPVNPNWLTYTTALVLAVLSGILFGITPIRQVFRMDAYELVKAGASAGRVWRRLTLRDVLLVVQIAVCAVLVTSSLVAVRGLARSLHSDFGFSPQGAMLAAFDLKMAGYDDAKAEHFQREALDAIKQIPGVYAAGYIDHPPLNVASSDTSVYTNGTTDFRPLNAAADAMYYKVSPGYLDAARTVLLAGRDFTWHDDAKSPKVAVVNEAFARKVFGSVDRAIGGYFLRGSGERFQVIGVVQDGKYRTLTEALQPAMFLPMLQDTDTWTTLVVRSSRSDKQLAAAMQKTLASLDPGLPASIQRWQDSMDTALFAARAATVALGVMGMLGAMLAVTGIFGMASYSVSKRMRELGIRVALGARRTEVLTAALGRSAKLLCAGSAAGLLLGMAATRVLQAVVYQATPRDPLVIFGSLAAMILLGVFASWLPARRAAAVDPAILLREE